MKAPRFLVVADRGGAKAFHVEEPGGREAMPRLVDSFELEDAHAKYNDVYTDQAGGFPSRAPGLGGQGNSAAEELTVQEELETRVIRQLAERINAILEKHHPDRWALAAPAGVNSALLDRLSDDARNSLGMNVPKDLVKTPVPRLLGFFEQN
jgi:hypothetical protein